MTAIKSFHNLQTDFFLNGHKGEIDGEKFYFDRLAVYRAHKVMGEIVWRHSIRHQIFMNGSF